jgi:hypothetical protein
VESARGVVNSMEAPPILSDTLKSGADAVKEVVKPMEEKKIELEQKMEETRKEVEVKTSFIRVGLTRMDEFRKHYPDEVIYGTGLLFAFPSFLREYERTPHFTFLLMMHR